MWELRRMFRFTPVMWQPPRSPCHHHQGGMGGGTLSLWAWMTHPSGKETASPSCQGGRGKQEGVKPLPAVLTICQPCWWTLGHGGATTLSRLDPGLRPPQLPVTPPHCSSQSACRAGVHCPPQITLSLTKSAWIDQFHIPHQYQGHSAVWTIHGWGLQGTYIPLYWGQTRKISQSLNTFFPRTVRVLKEIK